MCNVVFVETKSTQTKKMDQEIQKQDLPKEEKEVIPIEKSIEEKTEEILKEANLLEAGKILDDKKKALLEIEDRVSKRLKQIEASIKTQEMSGRSISMQTKEETPDDKWAREAKIRYAGTGMDPTPK